MTDTVSVIIPAYNAAAYIERAVASALSQSPAPVEIIVVDDGSSDATVDIVGAMPPPVRLVRQPNGGPGAARNHGARLASGTWLAFLDADDTWLPGKLQMQLTLGQDPTVGLVHCLPGHRKEAVPDVITFDALWERNTIVNSSVLVRRTAFEEMHGFDERRELISVEDYNLWLRIAASGWKIVTCQQILVHYTQGIGLSSQSGKYRDAQLRNIDALAVSLGLPPDKVRNKQAQIIEDFGSRALHERDLATARRLLAQAFRQRPRLRTAIYFMAAYTPAWLLDTRRAIVSRRAIGTVPASHVPSGVSVVPEACVSWLTSEEDRTPPIARPAAGSFAALGGFSRPVLVTTIDAEEDFDWNRPFSRAFTDVTSMRSQHLAHRIFERYGVKPTYLVDYPIATQDAGRKPLQELLQSDACDIGAQLHPWVTIPFSEHVSSHNSYPGNLAPTVEYQKIRNLTEAIAESFGDSPRIFRAGRYGVGPNTGRILRHLQYEVDCSVVPHWDFSGEGGPDFRSLVARPYWVDPDKTLLELPLSAAVIGAAAGLSSTMTSWIFQWSSERARLPSVMARLGLVERIKLTPEGIGINDAKRLVRHMLSNGNRVFVLSYHSPSLEVGNTPYVRTSEDLRRFLAWLEEFYDFFTTEINGVNVTWRQVRETILQADKSAER